MTTTRGWKRDECGGYWKSINGIVWQICPVVQGGWGVGVVQDRWAGRVTCFAQALATRSTLDEVKALAHATAELWEGRNDG